jgi:hypothetical protein
MPEPEAESPEEQSSHSADDTLKNLVQQVNNGDNAALGRLRKVLDGNPEIWRRVGNLAAHARMTLIRLIAGDDKFLSESIERKATEMEVELLGPSSTTLERLSVERVVASWLQLQYADTMSATATKDNLSHFKFWSQHQDRAHKRYQSAVKQLLAIRDLVPKTTKKAVESEAGSPAPTGVRHAGPGTEPRPAGSNGHGEGNGSRSGNGQAPKPADGPKPTNGEPINRILMFGQAKEVAAATD